MPVFACKSKTAAEAAGHLPTTVISLMLEPINAALLAYIHCCGCNSLKQQMPAENQQHSKKQSQQHSRNIVEQQHEHRTHSRGMQPELFACHCSEREGLLINCCGCGWRLTVLLALQAAVKKQHTHVL
jgi:hypothetical protein